MITVLKLLQTGRPNVETLAQSCQVSRRTIFRDLDMLRKAGIPILFDPHQQRYYLAGSFFLPPTHFTAEEALALITLCYDMGENEQLPFFHAARKAALKIIGALPEDILSRIKTLGGALKLRTEPSNPLHEAKAYFDMLLESHLRNRAVRIEYKGPLDDEPFSTMLHPYQVLFSRRSWYVIGRSSLHREVRTFHVGRIRNIEMTDQAYEIPKGFSLERYLRNAWHLIPESVPDEKVHLLFEPLVAQNVAEVKWHKTQRCEWREDGRLDFFVTVSGLKEISWWILGYGDQVEVIAPESLRIRIVDHARKLVEKYDAA
jgi:proteasome accessory factor B